MERRKKDSRSKHFAGLGLGAASNSSADPLEVLGLPSTLFSDPGTALFIDSGRHLLPWFGDEANLVDRYDVRLLLDDLSGCDNPAIPAASAFPEPDDPDAAELHAERFSELDPAKEHQLAHPIGRPVGDAAQDASDEDASSSSQGSESDEDSSASEDTEDSQSSSSSEDAPLPPPPRKPLTPPYQAEAAASAAAVAAAEAEREEQEADARRAGAAIGFTYEPEPVQAGEGAGAPPTASQAGEDSSHPEEPPDEPYVPHFEVPERLAASLPASERLHKIMIETARFVRKGGGQVEVLLRVRQASNPTFNFLLPGNPGYPYYRWIVETNPKELTPPPSAVPTEAPHSTPPPEQKHTDDSAQAEAAQADTLTSLLSFYGNDEEEEQGTQGDGTGIVRRHSKDGGVAEHKQRGAAAAELEGKGGVGKRARERGGVCVEGEEAEVERAGEPAGRGVALEREGGVQPRDSGAKPREIGAQLGEDGKQTRQAGGGNGAEGGGGAGEELPAPGCESEPAAHTTEAREARGASAAAAAKETSEAGQASVPRGGTPEPGGDEDAKAIMSKLVRA